MKTLVGKFVLVAAVSAALAPLNVVAQNIASQPGTVNRSVDRLTLLPGPNLLSPARGTPGEWRFVPAYRPHGQHRLETVPPSANGTLILGSDTQRAPSVPGVVTPALSPDLFRFDTPFRPASSPLRLQAVPPTPKRE